MKLFDIRKKYSFTNNPYEYKNFHQKTNDTTCFRCVYTGNISISKNIDLNSIYNERDVNIIKYNLNQTAIYVIYFYFECEHLGKEFVFLRECDKVPDVFFFSCILFFCTFMMAITLRNIKFSNFFPTFVSF